MFARNVSSVLLVISLLAPLSLLRAAQAGPGDQRFYEAYFLERAEGDCSAAADLYKEVASNRRADDELRERAKARLIACREELASTDLAKLMPPDALVYFELNRPGEQVVKLLEKLGLLAGTDRVASEGNKRIAIGPELVSEVLGIRGAAVAITGFDPRKGAPSGVLVFHPGKLEVIRGLIETGLAAIFGSSMLFALRPRIESPCAIEPRPRCQKVSARLPSSD